MVCAIRYSSFLFQTDPAGVVAKPNQVAGTVVVVADAFGNGQVQHVVLCIAPVGFTKAYSFLILV